MSSKDEQKLYGFGLTWRWVNNDKPILKMGLVEKQEEIAPNNSMLPLFTACIIV